MGTLDVRGWTLKVGRRALNVRRWTLYVGRSDVERWTLDVGRCTWEVGSRTSDVRRNVGRRTFGRWALEVLTMVVETLDVGR